MVFGKLRGRGWPVDKLRERGSGRVELELAGAVEGDGGLDPGLPAMRAHGVVELGAHLRGEATLAEAGARTVLATGQYTKRQATWFRHRRIVDPCHAHTIHARYASYTQDSERHWALLSNFLNVPG